METVVFVKKGDSEILGVLKDEDVEVNEKKAKEALKRAKNSARKDEQEKQEKTAETEK